ncbi:MAG: LytTR family transcriptional regulator DNA-binding domain-containing protein [Cytophagia bacterium]|nr:LytTR family transcriptional regulator DNA-binding domain-containing protein [Cytophagia bacterium]NVK82969.1 LytTR family transcriptional regulator DNA-binding domain-containing protein [Cytophagia bacterium]
MTSNKLNKVKALIVEDELNYADTLEMFIDELGYEVSGIASSGKEALTVFEKESPDLVLMDINLEGELTGIDLARIFQGQKPTPIIFITSFDDSETFAKAKKTGPFAYLIKPFDPPTLQRSIELALEHAYAEGEQVFDNQEEVVLASSCFFVKDRNKLFKIKLEEILWVEVEDKYCMIHTRERKFTLRQSLKELAEKLDPAVFVQTHRSYIVNATEIEDIDLTLYVVTINGTEIPLGRGHKDELVNRLQTL